ncbi:unnamed protein product [Symbiodinium sp. CCMP2456]|nr:unnamed protein product [Symbiodinium sp. CCMP2456]
MAKSNKQKVQLGGADIPVPVNDVAGDSDDLMSPTKKRASEAAQSSGKRERGTSQTLSLDYNSLRDLLREQSAELLGKQKHQLDEAIGELETRTFSRVDAIQNQVVGLEEKHESFEAKLGELEKGLKHIEEMVKGGHGGSASGGSFVSEDKRQSTLVVGGWPKDSRRKAILADLKEALEALQLTKYQDEPAFCTGPRRSVALVPMGKRQSETPQGHRDRMFKFVQAFAAAEVMTRDGVRLWCSFSKTPEQRQISSHAGLIKRVLARFLDDVSDLVDIEWKTGTDVRKTEVFDDTPRKHWINVGLISVLTKQTAQAVRVRNLRKKARKTWETSRVERAAQGDWHAFRATKHSADTGWAEGYAAAQKEDPHQTIHDHLTEVYRGRPPRPCAALQEEVQAFTIEELEVALGQMQGGKAVGCDGTSKELLVGLAGIEGGKQHLAEFFTKAFDSLDREQVLTKLIDRLGDTAETRCWRQLLQENVGFLQTPWGSSHVRMQQGIRQGAIESPILFALAAELCLAETARRFRWDNNKQLFEGFTMHEMLFMDDSLLWGQGTQELETRIKQLMVVLSEYGLKLNGSKCQLLTSPHWGGAKFIHVGGVKVEAVHTMEIMGLPMRVGMSMCELIGPLLSRAKSKFWAAKHVLRSHAPVKGRLQLMERLVGGAVQWCLAAFPPDRSDIGLLNSTQQLISVWAMKLGKRDSENWEGFRKRSHRAARAALHHANLERWGTSWIRKWWRYSGHRARGLLRDAPPIRAHIDSFRTLSWWTGEKRKKDGLQHTHHYPKLMNMERAMDAAAGEEWRVVAQDRVEWRRREQTFVDNLDLPWSSSRQTQLLDWQ